MDVDEARRDRFPAGVDHARTVRGQVGPDRDDPVVSDRDVRHARRCPGPVDDGPAAEQQVGHAWRRSRPLPRSRRLATISSFRDEGPAGLPS